MAKHHKNSAEIIQGIKNDQADKTRAVQSRPAVLVEFPRESDAIAQPSYTIQIAATQGADGVEVSIDKGDWMPCREALGLWWFDWSGFDKGDHELVARTRLGDGISANSAPRRFSVA